MSLRPRHLPGRPRFLIASRRRYLRRFASPSGVAPSLVLDLANGVYAVNEAGWAQPYRAGVLPSLVMDFENDVYGAGFGAALKVQTFDDIVDFERAGTAWALNAGGLLVPAAANVPRFAHDASGRRLGLLGERDKTNAVLGSTLLTDGDYWTPNGADISGAPITGPDGAASGLSLVGTTDGFAEGRLSYQASAMGLAGQAVTSWFGRAGATDWLNITKVMTGGNNARFRFDLASGTIGGNTISSGVTAAEYGIIEYPDGWRRCWAACTPPDGETHARSFAQAVDGNSNDGAVGTGIYVFGPQTEPGSRPTSYIPTGISTVTRAFDDAAVDAFPWVATQQGTLIAVGRRPGTSGALAHLRGTDEFGDRITLIAQADGRLQAFANRDSTLLANIGNVGTAPAEGAPFAAAVTWSADRIAACLNGSTVAEATSGAPYAFPPYERMRLGGITPLNTVWNSTLAQVRYYPEPLPDADIQQITTELAGV